MIELAIDWFKQEPVHLRDYIDLFVLIFFFGVVFAAIGFLQLGRRAGGLMYDRTRTLVEHGKIGAVSKLVIFVVGEETLYRYFGVGGAVYLFPDSSWAVLAAAVAISVPFGLLPPHNVLPLRTRVAVIIGGFILSLLYLKCGGWQGEPFKPLLFTIGAHLWVSSIITASFAYYRR